MLVHKRNVPAILFATLLFLGTAWNLTHAIQHSMPDAATQFQWFSWGTILLPVLGAAWIVVAVETSGMVSISVKHLWVIIPTLLLLLFVASVLPGEACQFTFQAFSLLGLLILLSAWHDALLLHRKRIALVASACLFPTLADTMHSTGLMTAPGLNPAPLFFLPGSVLLLIAVFRCETLQSIPITRSAVSDHLLEGVLVHDPHQTIVDINNIAAALIKRPRTELLGKKLKDLPPPWNQLLSQLNPEDGAEQELDDHRFSCDCLSIRRSSDQLDATVIMIRDISNEKRRQKHHVDNKMMNLQKMLVRDIHDGLGGLAANMAFITALARAEEDLEKKNEWIDKLQLLAKEANIEIRELMNSLECRSMAWPNIIDAINRITNAMFDDKLYTIHIETHGRPPKDDPGMTAGLSITHIAKECMNNIVKHAKADQVSIELNFKKDHFHLIVSDNGCGFDPETVRRGRGLNNLKKRAAELGGTLDIKMENGSRFKIVLPLPIRHE